MLTRIQAVVNNIVTGMIILLLFALPLAWVLRDGLGPDSSPSSGILSIEKTFWTFYWGPIFSVLLVVLLFSYRKKNNILKKFICRTRFFGFQFSLKSRLVAFAVFTVFLTFIGVYIRAAWNRIDSENVITKISGITVKDLTVDRELDSILSLKPHYWHLVIKNHKILDQEATLIAKELKKANVHLYLDIDHSEISPFGLQELINGFEQTIGVYFYGTPDIRQLIPVIVESKHLKEVSLENTTCKDKDIEALSNSLSLERIDLTGTLITDASCKYLLKIPTLKYVTLDKTNVTTQGVRLLSTSKTIENISILLSI